MSLCSFAVPLRRFLLGCLSLALVGCMEIEEKFTLNPDGSGKFAITEILNVPLFKKLDPPPTYTSQPIEDLLSSTILKTKGVDVWAEANGKILPDGRWELKLQGYFEDFSAFRLLPEHPREVLEALQRGGTAGAPVDFIDMKLGASGKDREILHLHPESNRFLGITLKQVKANPEKKPPATNPAPPIDPQLKMALEKGRPRLVGSKLTSFYNFGEGEIISAETFTRVNAHTAKIETDFTYMAEHGLKAMALFAGPNKKDVGEAEILTYGNCPYPAGKDAKGLPDLVVNTKGPAFPYAEESAKAKAAQSPALKKMVEKRTEADPDGTAALKKLLDEAKAKAPPGKK